MTDENGNAMECKECADVTETPPTSTGFGWCPAVELGLNDEPQVAADLESTGQSDVLKEATLEPLDDPPSGVPYATSVLAEASDLVNNGRKTAYGHPIDNFDRIARGWSVIFGIPVSRRQVAQAFAWAKIARDIETPKRDNAVDLAGYAALMEEV